MLFDEGEHFVGNEIAYRLAFGNASSNFRGGNVDAARQGWEQMRGTFCAAIEHDELHQRFQFPDAPPRMQFAHIVLADEVKKFAAGWRDLISSTVSIVNDGWARCNSQSSISKRGSLSIAARIISRRADDVAGSVDSLCGESAAGMKITRSNFNCSMASRARIKCPL